jgi:hypothetical protein
MKLFSMRIKEPKIQKMSSIEKTLHKYRKRGERAITVKLLWVTAIAITIAVNGMDLVAKVNGRSTFMHSKKVDGG